MEEVSRFYHTHPLGGTGCMHHVFIRGGKREQESCEYWLGSLLIRKRRKTTFEGIQRYRVRRKKRMPGHRQGCGLWRSALEGTSILYIATLSDHVRARSKMVAFPQVEGLQKRAE